MFLSVFLLVFLSVFPPVFTAYGLPRLVPLDPEDACWCVFLFLRWPTVHQNITPHDLRRGRARHARVGDRDRDRDRDSDRVRETDREWVLERKRESASHTNTQERAGSSISR